MADPLNVWPLRRQAHHEVEVAPLIASEKAIIDSSQISIPPKRQNGGHHPGLPGQGDVVDRCGYVEVSKRNSRGGPT